MAKNILIVEDSKTTRKLLMYILTGSGFSVIHAENGIEAIEKLAYKKIDIIITDLNMPQMDGFELIRSLKDNNDYKEIPVIVLSTEGNGFEINKCMEIGASSYLVKPITNNKLINEVNKLI